MDLDKDNTYCCNKHNKGTLMTTATKRQINRLNFKPSFKAYRKGFLKGFMLVSFFVLLQFINPAENTDVVVSAHIKAMSNEELAKAIKDLRR
jgi:hypothetical protein